MKLTVQINRSCDVALASAVSTNYSHTILFKTISVEDLMLGSFLSEQMSHITILHLSVYAFMPCSLADQQTITMSLPELETPTYF